MTDGEGSLALGGAFLGAAHGVLIDLMLSNGNSGLEIGPFAAAMSVGDTFAKSVFEEAGMLLGAALASAANLLDMHVFIIGGGVAQAGPVLFDSALATLRSRVLANLRPVVEIRKAQFGNQAGMIGAAMLVS